MYMLLGSMQHMRAQWSRALALWSHRSYQTPTSAGSHHRTGTGSLLRNHVAVTARPHTPNPDQLPPAEHHAQLLINPSSSSSTFTIQHRPSPRLLSAGASNGSRRRHDTLLRLRRLLAVLLRPRHRVDGVLLPGPEHDAGDADGRVDVRRRRCAAAADSGGAGAGGEAGAGGNGGARRAASGRVATEEAAAGRELVAAVPRRRQRAADEAGRVPGHGAAARRRRLPVRWRRRPAGAGGAFGGRDAAVRGREGAPAAAARRPAGGAREVATAAGRGGLVHVLVAGKAPGAAHRHLQRRRGVVAASRN
ncbi:hypothetical protein ACQJBY_063716 [Aegilops geniculata]